MYAIAWIVSSLVKIQSPQQLGVLVRLERTKRKWTQAELAERVGVKPLWVSEFERGKTTAQIGLVFRTIKALGLHLTVEKVDRPTGAGTVIDLEDLVRARGLPDEIISRPGETPDDAIRRAMKEQRKKKNE